MKRTTVTNPFHAVEQHTVQIRPQDLLSTENVPYIKQNDGYHKVFVPFEDSTTLKVDKVQQTNIHEKTYFCNEIPILVVI